MIILYHNQKEALFIENTATKETINCTEKNIQKSLFILSQKHENTLLVWCHEKLKTNLNKEELKNIFHHQLIFASYSIDGNYIINKSIGYVDQHCFINVKKEVTYPTWLMSSDIGGINSEVLKKGENSVNIKQSFDEFLCSLAKVCMPKGLLCYSEPKLSLNTDNKVKLVKEKSNNSVLFNFVKRHYKTQWVFIMLVNQFIFSKKLLLIPFVKSLLIQKVKKNSLNFDNFNIKSSKKNISKEAFTVDVLIPTLGRKEHLHNVLRDLSNQTLLPQKVIIVEQNGDKKCSSELDFLNQNWPFEIDHTFIHRLGACNARNIALSKVTGDWVFFADDDVRFDKDLLEKSYNFLNKYGTLCFTFSCLQKNEIEKQSLYFQWSAFGTNASIVKSEFLKHCSFKSEHEFGYGEDLDFGRQLKNRGCDNIYNPNIKMLHLKAPIGGFRYKFIHPWSSDLIGPKPSPTVMAYNLKHLTNEQLRLYKLLLFLKFYKVQSIKNPILYIKNYKKRWDSSVQWADKLIKNEI